MKIKATEKFKELGIENNYQHLETEQYYSLRRGENVDLKNVPPHLLAGEFVEKVKIKEK